jgi:hypothetical protein
MTIYTDSDYKCHASEGDGYTAHDVAFFDDKCDEFIEGYRYIPEGETWTREDGVVFTGCMTAPWKDYNTLERAQLQYVAEQLEKIKEVYA